LCDISNSVYSVVKPVRFLGDSLKSIRAFPADVRRDVGFQLEALQPADFKPMPSIGAGVEELRVRDKTGAYRVIFVARAAEAVCVLHAFQKKSRETPKHDIEIARDRYAQLKRRQP